MGSGASHLVTGHGAEHEALEEELAAFTGREKALVFSTGYMANMGVIDALADQKSALVSDKLNHASLIDGCRLSGAERAQRYRHGDAAHAAELLAAARPADDNAPAWSPMACSAWTATSRRCRSSRTPRARRARGWSSMTRTGSACSAPPAAELRALRRCRRDDVPVLVGTFGKAFGTFGAFVAGDAELIEFLIQKARTYIYTTALPPAVAAATRAALRVERAGILAARESAGAGAAFRAGLERTALAASPGNPCLAPPSMPVVLGECGARAGREPGARGSRAFSSRRFDRPTVPAGTARLRVTLSAAHEEAQVDALVDALVDAWRRCRHERAGSARSLSRSTGAPWRRPSIAPAPGYDAAAALQERVRNELIARLDELKVSPRTVLDLGAGTGHGSRALKRRFPKALVVAADIAPGMLERAKQQSRWLRRFERVRADAYSLPFRDGAFDLVFSSLMLQWCDDLDAVFAEICARAEARRTAAVQHVRPRHARRAARGVGRERRGQQSRESFLRSARARQRADARGALPSRCSTSTAS